MRVFRLRMCKSRFHTNLTVVLPYCSTPWWWWLTLLINAPTRTVAACTLIKRLTGKFIVLSRMVAIDGTGLTRGIPEMTPAQHYDQRIRTDNHKSPAKVRSYLLWLIVAKWCHMVTRDTAFVQIVPDNGLLPHGTKPLPEPIRTYHQSCSVACTWEQNQSISLMNTWIQFQSCL